MIQITDLSKDFAGRTLFREITWRVGKTERIGLVGENGTGKSTLLKIIAGLEEPSAGSIRRAKGTTAGYLPQQGITVRGRTLFCEVLSSLEELQEIEQEIATITRDLENTSTDENHDTLLDRLGSLEEKFRLKGGYSREAAVGSVLRGLGFSSEDWEKECSTFSGGWQMRIALAKLLLQRPNILLLDEPTNHLDIEARNWLEMYLRDYPFAVILVSHDRFFMDQVCHKITEVWNQTLTDYTCSYSQYLVEREERVSRLREAKERQDEEIAKIEDFISRFRYKADKASLVQSRIKQLEKIERIVMPPERKRIRFSFPEPPRSGRVVLELEDVTKAYGEHIVLNGISLVVEKGERISLVGHNGAGKSTLMRVLAGDGFQSGQRTVGANVAMDFFAQDQTSALDASRTVYEELLDDAPYDTVPVLRDLLGAFLFSGDDIHKKVGVLSGGEQSRLALAKMLLRPSNVLLLDEPTNHLDLFSKDVLLDALLSFKGTVVFVSHDRYFINALATRTIEVGNGAIHSYMGNYEEYINSTGINSRGDNHVSPRKNDRTPSGESREISAEKNERMLSREEEKRRQREERARLKKLAELESQIIESESELSCLERAMGKPDYYCNAERAKEGAREHDKLSSLIAGLYEEWEALQASEV